MAGGVFSGAKLHAMTIRESTNDGSDFTNPDADFRRLFLGEDGLLWVKDSAGTVTHPYDGAGGIAASLADTAGDMLVASANDTWAKLAMGAVGGVVGRVNGAVAWNGGTSFPGSKATGDRFWRSDLKMEFVWDGTRWLSTQVFTVQMLATNSGGILGGELRSSISATQGAVVRLPTPSLLSGSDIWWVDHQLSFIVQSGGTALGASHKWVGTVLGLDSAAASTGTIATVNIDSGSSAVWRQVTTAIGAVKVTGSLLYTTTWTKTGTPGNLAWGETLSYRIIAT